MLGRLNVSWNAAPVPISEPPPRCLFEHEAACPRVVLDLLATG